MKAEPIGLREAISTLRSELAAAIQEGEGKQLRFTAGPIEMEFLVQVGREKSGQAGIQFWVVSIGGDASATTSETHRVKLTLTPLVSGEDALITDQSDRPR